MAADLGPWLRNCGRGDGLCTSEATAEDLRETVLRISDEVWTEFFADHFGPDPYHIMGAYQHMVAHPLYLPDYAIGDQSPDPAHVRGRRGGGNGGSARSGA